MANDKTGREPGRTVTRADLAEVVYQRVGLSRTESADLVQSVLDEICDAAERGETVKLSGFGSFVVRSKGERIGRNPKTGSRSADPAAPRHGVQTVERAQDEDQQPERRRQGSGVIAGSRVSGVPTPLGR